MVSVTKRLINELKPNGRNARTHSKKQIHQIAASIKEFGFLNPALIDEHDVIVAGHGRVEAAKVLGMAEVPTIRIDHLSDAQKRAYVLADNKLALKAGWDPEILAIELNYLAGLDVTFDVEITGFETAEIDLIIDRPPTGGSGASAHEDEVPRPLERAVTSIGDTWQLGDHKSLAGTREQNKHMPS
jgi:ParB-like chromosome segregation protein Spo0J